jgi:dienelactone hydrolase
MNRNILRAPLWLLLALCADVSYPAEIDSAIVIPRPTGEFGVGTVVWHWTDPSRLDEITPYPGDVREIMAQAWYPVDGPATEPTDVYAPLDKDLTAKGWSRPGEPFSSHIRKAPVIVLCPGSRTTRHFYTSVAEDLASHGYVVLSVDSPHIVFTFFPDGRVITPTYFPPPELFNGPYSRVDEFLEGPGSLAAADFLFALESLKKISEEDPAQRLTGKLDWKRLGAFGHSTGARACGRVATADHRVRAFASMEGTVLREERQRGIDTPILLMLGPFLPQFVVETILEMIPNRRDEIFLLRLQSFVHNNVNELPLLFPSSFRSLLNPVAALEQTREILRTFFDDYVRETGPGTLSLSRPPLMTLEHYPGLGRSPSR